MRTPERILLIRPSALGDVCRTVPVLSALRAAYPAARIDWMVRDAFADAVRHHPALSGVVPFPRDVLGRELLRGRPGPTLSFFKLLREPRYDTVVDCQGLARSGLFALVAGARSRVGETAAREIAPLLMTRRARTSRSMHTVDRMLAITRAAGADVGEPDMRLYIGSMDREAAERAVDGSRPIVVAPTSIWPGKRWPVDRFAALVSGLLAEVGGPVAVVGGPKEREQCGPLIEMAQADPRVLDLIGKTSVGELMAVIERARLVVCNDSAVAHMAVGFDRPMVALYGPTRVERVGPFRRETDVIQHARPGDRFRHKDSETSHDMMRRIGVDEVLAASLERLD